MGREIGLLGIKMSESIQDTAPKARNTVTAAGRHISRAPGSIAAKIWLHYGKLVDRIREREAPDMPTYAPTNAEMTNEIRDLFNTYGVRSTHPIKKAPVATGRYLGDLNRTMAFDIHAIPDFSTSHNISELRQLTENYRTTEVPVIRTRTNETSDMAEDNMAKDNLNILITNILPGDTEGVNHGDLIQECKLALAVCGAFTNATVLRRPTAKNLRVLLTCDSLETKQKAIQLAWTLIYSDGCHIVDPQTYSEEKMIKSEAGRVLQVGGYGQLLAAHLTEYMQATNGKAITVPPRYVDGRRGTVAYILYNSRAEMLAAAETPVYFNGRTNAQHFADKEKRPRPAMPRHRPDPQEATTGNAWIPIMACFRCHSDKHVHKACPEKDAQYKTYVSQIDSILRGGRISKDKVSQLRQFIMSAEAREEPVLPQNELAYNKIRNAGIAMVHWKMRPRKILSDEGSHQTKESNQVKHAKAIPGHHPTSYAAAMNLNPTQPNAPSTNAKKATTEQKIQQLDMQDSNSSTIQSLLKKTAKLEQDLQDLTQVIAAQQNIIQLQTEKLTALTAMITQDREGVGRPALWIPAKLRPIMRPSEADSKLNERTSKLGPNFLLEYTQTAMATMKHIEGRGFGEHLVPWIYKIVKVTTMTADIALEAFTYLQTTLGPSYGLGEWHLLTSADKDYEFMQERAPTNDL